jgi:hypothetical protein
MTYFDDDISLNDENIEGKERYSTLGERTREFVGNLLVDGAKPQEVSYVLAYVATELGLRVTENSYMVFPMVLSGVKDAGDKAIEVEGARDRESNTPIPDNVIQLHDGEVIH